MTKTSKSNNVAKIKSLKEGENRHIIEERIISGSFDKEKTRYTLLKYVENNDMSGIGGKLESMWQEKIQDTALIIICRYLLIDKTDREEKIDKLLDYYIQNYDKGFNTYIELIKNNNK